MAGEARLPEWISVKEKLPKIGQEVLLAKPQCDYYSHIPNYSHTRFEVGCRTGDGWDIADDNWLKDDVTHWMALPEPPDATEWITFVQERRRRWDREAHERAARELP